MQTQPRPPMVYIDQRQPYNARGRRQWWYPGCINFGDPYTTMIRLESWCNTEWRSFERNFCWVAGTLCWIIKSYTQNFLQNPKPRITKKEILYTAWCDCRSNGTGDGKLIKDKTVKLNPIVKPELEVSTNRDYSKFQYFHSCYVIQIYFSLLRRLACIVRNPP